MTSELTPEEMDELEAQYLVRWEREAIVMRHVLAAVLQSRGHEDVTDETFTYLGKLWLE